jgi:uncharacterized membrane protein YdfJ with MMPL/SSD domain
MFAALGRAVYRRRWIVLIAGLAFMLASGLAGTTLFGTLKTGGYDNPEAESIRAVELLRKELNRDDRTLVVLFTSNDGLQVDDPEYKAEVEETLARLEGQPNIGRTTSYFTTGAAQFVSNDRLSTYAAVGVNGDDDVQMQVMDVVRPLLTSDRLQVRLGGYPATAQDITEQVEKDLQRAELLSFPVVFVLLIVVFGSVVAASLPLFIGAFTILGGLMLLRLATTVTDMSVFAVNIITMLGLGLAIDYSLFVVSRFREELVRHDNDVSLALSRTMQTAGRTVVFSGLTVMISLMSLVIFPQMLMKSLGWGGSAAVLVAMVATVTVLPAALALLGPRVNRLSVKALLPARLRREAAHPDNPEGSFWYRASSFVMRHPVVVLVLTVIPLALVGLPFLRIVISIPDHRALPEGAESRDVGDMLVSNFPHNETTPIEIAVRAKQSALDPASISALFDYTRDIAALPGVRRVDSMVNLDPRLDAGGVTAYTAFYGAIGKPLNPMAAQAEQAAGLFSGGTYSMVRVLFDSGTLSTESQRLVQNIRGMPTPGGLEATVGGRTAELIDFVDSLRRSVPVAVGLIVVVMFVLLFLMLGSVVVPLTAVVLNTLSLSASFGALVWIFQDGNLANLLGFTPLGSIDGTMPVLIFATAFGLSMDYEVFLLSRIKEQYDRTRDTSQAVATGVQKTGAIITSAALLLVVVISSFAIGEVLFMKQVGVGLGLAILVDATLVRMLLVPATMRLLGKYNWWAPRPLVALYERLGMGERDIDETLVETQRRGERREPAEIL